MSWVKLTDTFAEDPRLDEAGPLGLALHVAALCYCSRQLTDGRISHTAVRRLLALDPDTLAATVEGLVRALLWHPTDTGYELVDYLEHQPSSSQVREQQDLKKARQQRWRESKRRPGDAGGDASTGTSHDASRDAGGDAAPPRPAPPRRKAGAGRGGTPTSARATGGAATPVPGDSNPWDLGIRPRLTVNGKDHPYDVRQEA